MNPVALEFYKEGVQHAQRRVLCPKNWQTRCKARDDKQQQAEEKIRR